MFYKIIYLIVVSLYRLLYRTKFFGRENTPDGACLICANHTSTTDPIFLAACLTSKHHLYFMAKAELLRIPVIGFVLSKVGVFPVNRGQSDMKAIKRALALLKSGEKVAMFPEGRRVNADEQAEARAGAIMLAARTGCPILPVYLTAGRKPPFRRIRGYIGKPYYVGGVKSRLTPEQYQLQAEALLRAINALAPGGAASG